jgi:hypothetical protein
MEHKAFAFNWTAFEKELRPMLEKCLESGDAEPLINFINTDHKSFKDPYEGMPLAQNWLDSLEVKDVQTCADFA